MKCKVAIIGGGIAGSSAALYLAREGIEVELFEKKQSLIEGPPMCHLHAGGNLYREISIEQCVRLLKESIDLIKLYPYAIDKRPTIIATPIYDNDDPKNQLKKLEVLKKEYEKLVQLDNSNEVLGKPEDYYKVYEKRDLERVKNGFIKDENDKWMKPFVENVDLSKIKYPVFLVQEYGLNVFRISATANLMLKKMRNVKLHLNTEVLDIEKKHKFVITFKKNNQIKKKEFDYLINAAGFESGKIDDILNYKRKRFVEFKAAYVTKWDKVDKNWPEIIFHGVRGTPQGMGQFTPYYGGYVQLHAMTKDITLFDDGLVKTKNSSQPNLPEKYINYIRDNWDEQTVKERTLRAIEHLNQFLPSFNTKEYFKPLFGAQQIPGEDENLRAAEVSFEENYARCEIVKASSVFAMSEEILKKLENCEKSFEELPVVTKKDVDKLACKIAKERGYPGEMGLVNNSYLL